MGIGAASAGRRVQGTTGRSHAQSPCKSQVAQRFDEARPDGTPAIPDGQNGNATHQNKACGEPRFPRVAPEPLRFLVMRARAEGCAFAGCTEPRASPESIAKHMRRSAPAAHAFRVSSVGFPVLVNSCLDECEMNDPRRTDERSATKLLLTFEAACNQKPARELSKQAVISISLAPMARRNVWNFRVGAQASETSGFSFGTKQTRFRTEPMAGLQTKGGVQCGT